MKKAIRDHMKTNIFMHIGLHTLPPMDILNIAMKKMISTLKRKSKKENYLKTGTKLESMKILIAMKVR